MRRAFRRLGGGLAILALLALPKVCAGYGLPTADAFALTPVSESALRMTERWRAESLRLVASPLLQMDSCPPAFDYGFGPKVRQPLMVSEARQRMQEAIAEIAAGGPQIGETPDGSLWRITAMLNGSTIGAGFQIQY